MSQFLRVDNNDSADAKAIAIPRVFSENSRAKTTKLIQYKEYILSSCTLILSVMFAEREPQ